MMMTALAVPDWPSQLTFSWMIPNPFRKLLIRPSVANRVLKIRDYKCNKVYAPGSDEASLTGLPASNVLYFELSDDAWVCARPSGTEPKIKFYMGIKGESKADSEKKLEMLRKELLESVGQG